MCGRSSRREPKGSQGLPHGPVLQLDLKKNGQWFLVCSSHFCHQTPASGDQKWPGRSTSRGPQWAIRSTQIMTRLPPSIMIGCIFFNMAAVRHSCAKLCRACQSLRCADKSRATEAYTQKSIFPVKGVMFLCAPSPKQELRWNVCLCWCCLETLKYAVSEQLWKWSPSSTTTGTKNNSFACFSLCLCSIDSFWLPLNANLQQIWLSQSIPRITPLDSQLPLQQFSGYWTLAPDSCDPKGPEENHHNIILRWLRILLQSRVMLQPSSKSATMATMASAADSDPDPRDPTGWAWLAVPHGDSDGSQRQSWNKEWDFRKPMKITGNSMNINEPYIIYIYILYKYIYVHIIIYICIIYIL